MSELTQPIARRIIDRVSGGQPPEYGFQFFTAGLDSYLRVIDEEYLATLISQGGSSFKLVVGAYGGGKTHFLYAVRDIAWKHNFVTAHIDLSPNETPFSKLELVYRDIVRNMVPPLSPDEILSGYERGIDAFITRWYEQQRRVLQQHEQAGETWQTMLLSEVDSFRGIESTSFARAFRAAIRALAGSREQEFTTIGQWLKGEGYTAEHKKFNILQKIDKTSAFEMIRSLGQLIRQMKYSGLVISFDEAELHGSMSSKERALLMANLRQVIDECARSTFQGVMVFYAVPDAGFLQGRTQDYEALKQRLEPVLDEFNPTGVQIVLDQATPDPAFLAEVGRLLANVYQVAYACEFGKPEELRAVVDFAARAAIRERFAESGYKRLFVQKLIPALHRYRSTGLVPIEADVK